MVSRTESENGTTFVVQFNGLKMPESAAVRFEHAIQRAVMAELANLDLSRQGEADLILRFPDHTAGIWINWPERWDTSRVFGD